MIAADAPVQAVESTSYCLDGAMADGSHTRLRAVAMNGLRLGTRIRLIGPRSRTFFGLRIFYVRDRIGSGSELDFWHPSCATSRAWGRRPVRYQVMGAR